MSAANTRSRRIAFVSDALYPYNKGGKETRLFQVSTRLARAGFDVHIYTMQWMKEPNTIENGVHIHAICPLLPLYDGPRRSIKQGIIFGIACFRLLFAEFDVVDVDHMPFFPLYSMRIVCWLKGKPMQATWHEVWGKRYWKEYLPGIKGEIASLIESVSFRLPDTITAVSKMTTTRVKRAGFRGKLQMIPNGIDLAMIASIKPSTQTSDVIFAGRLLTHKHVDVLIEAIALLKEKNPDIKCLIIGDGPESSALQSQIAALHLAENISLLPFTKDVDTTYALMKSSRVFVLPSTREGFGLVVLEANACGLPVITIDHPDNAARDLITPAHGKLSELSPAALASAIRGILRRPHKIATDNLVEYDWDVIVQKLIKQYAS